MMWDWLVMFIISASVFHTDQEQIIFNQPLDFGGGPVVLLETKLKQSVLRKASSLRPGKITRSLSQKLHPHFLFDAMDDPTLFKIPFSLMSFRAYDKKSCLLEAKRRSELRIQSKTVIR